MNAEVLVIGAGPAGATVALNLAPFRQVVIADLQATPARRIGESLPPAASRLLTDMGLFEAFQRECHYGHCDLCMFLVVVTPRLKTISYTDRTVMDGISTGAGLNSGFVKLQLSAAQSCWHRPDS